MQAISINEELTDEISLHPDNVHPFGEVVHAYSTLDGKTKYYACIDCPQRGKVLWELRDYTLNIGVTLVYQGGEPETILD